MWFSPTTCCDVWTTLWKCYFAYGKLYLSFARSFSSTFCPLTDAETFCYSAIRSISIKNWRQLTTICYLKNVLLLFQCCNIGGGVIRYSGSLSDTTLSLSHYLSLALSIVLSQEITNNNWTKSDIWHQLFFNYNSCLTNLNMKMRKYYICNAWTLPFFCHSLLFQYFVLHFFHRCVGVGIIL